MALETFTKQPYEAFGISADLVNVLETGETIVAGSSTVTAVDKDGNPATSEVLNTGSKAVDGSKLVIQCQDGTEDKSPYKITFRMVTDSGNQYEVDVKMKIKET